jgi:uncharacterized protein
MMRYTRSRAALSAHFLPVFGALLIATSLGSAASAQSFDCRNARSADERAICQDSRLGDLDKQLADVYDRVGSKLSKEERAGFEKNETAFVNARHRCGEHRGCIEQSYRNRMQELLSTLPEDQSGRSDRRDTGKSSERQKASREVTKAQEPPTGTDEAQRDTAETSSGPPERSPKREETKSDAPSASVETHSRREEPVKTGSAGPNPPSRHEAEAALRGSPAPERQSRHKRRTEAPAVAPAAPEREEPASPPVVTERHPPKSSATPPPERHPQAGSSTASPEPSKPPEKRHSRAKHVATDTSAPSPAAADQAQPASKPEIKWVNPAPSR